MTLMSPVCAVAQTGGLVAAFGFNETSGTTTADASGLNNTGTLGAGVTRTTTGKFGGALVFSSSFVTVPNAASLNLTTAMTLEAWVFPTAMSSAATAVMKEQNGEFVYSLYAGNPTKPAGIFNTGTGAGTEHELDAPSALALNTWSHLTATYDGTTSRFYLNGVQVASTPFTGTIATSTGVLRIGGNGVWGEFFAGRIDEVRVYNRALSAAEVVTDMNTPVGGTLPPPDTTPPTVGIVNPSSTGTFTTTVNTVNMDGTAADNVGVTSVTWANNRGGSGTATGTTSWSVTGIALQPGANVLTVTAHDAAGNVSTATLTVTDNVPDTTVPTIAITAPTAGATYLTNATPLTVSGTAGDNVGVTSVTWTNSAGGSGTATGTTSWTASGIALQSGANVLTVTAHDAAGNIATATLTVTLDAIVPTVAIANPSSTGSFTTTTSPLSMDGTAGDNAGVTSVTWANNRGGSGTATGTTSWSVSGIVLQVGANVLTVTAHDAAGNLATSTLTVTYNVADTTVPTIGITSPTSGATYLTNATPVTVSGTAADNVGVTSVTWTNSAGGSGTATGTTAWSASGIVLQPGANVLTVTAHDAAGNVGAATLSVTLDATVPTVTVTAPAAGATVSGSTVSLTASAADNGALAGVTFLLDGAAIGTEVLGTGPTYTLTWNTVGVTNGAHTLGARARDAAGNTGLAPTVSVTVSNAAPSGLVAAYGFNEASGTTTPDASGFNNNGTLGAGVTRTTSGKFGGAVVFAGDFVTVPNAASLNLTTAMTLEAWVFPTAAANGATAVMKEQAGEFVYSLYVGNPSKPAGIFNTGTGAGTEHELDGPSVMPLNTWSHLTATYDGTTSRFYVNGVQVASKAFTGTIATSTGALRIGGNGVWGEFFTGRIDEVRVYNRALSAAEVLTDMNTPVGGTLPPPDTTVPTVGIVNPSSTGTFTTTVSTVNMDGTAADNVGVTSVTWANNRGGSGTAAGTTSWSVSGIALQPGANVLTVTAHDAAGNVATATLTVTDNIPDTTVPTIAITAPTAASTYATNATPVTLSGTAADNVGVTSVTWTNSMGGSGTATGTTTWSVSGIVLQPGANVVTVTAHDAAGNVGASTLSVTLDAIAPTVALTTPAAGATVSGSAVALTASASDNSVLAGVTFLLDGSAIGTEVLGAGPTYTLSWNTAGVTNGTHTLGARARDAAGNTGLATTVSVTVSNVVPSGLVAAYGFNEASGTTVADASGNNNTGTLGSGVTRTTSGVYGGALSFNNGFVTVPHAASLNLTTALTIEAWVNPTSLAAWSTAVMKEQPNEFVYTLYAGAPTTPGGYLNVGTSAATERQINGAFPLALNAWNHLATTYDGTTARLYVNGVQVASKAFTGPIATSTGALRIGGNGVWGEFFAGRIDEVRIYNRALSSTEVYLDMVTAVGATLPPDNSPPTVALTSPAGGAVVNGAVSLTATANDDVGIAGVQFMVDGAPVGPRAQTAPYTGSWDASTAAEGVHTIEAVALDFSGKTTTSAGVQVTVTVPNGATLGHWTAPFDWPLVSLHAALLHTGEVLGYEYSGAGGPVLWNPLTNQFTPVEAGSNLFCSGLSVLSDGRVLVAGGHIDTHVGLPDLNIFDPLTRTWTRGPNMKLGRWYPTVTALPDGRALITSGEINCDGCNAPLPEVYNPLTNQVTQLTSASMNFPYYPHMYVLPDGRVLAAASSEAPIVTRVLNVATQTWSVVDPVAVDGGSSVQYLPGKIMKSGTSHNPDLPADPSFPRTYVLDMTAPTPAWTQTASMAFPRTYHTLTSLPDGSVLATGGATTTDPVSEANAVLAAELWNPTTKTWSTLSSGEVPRMYHSIAILLPDGRVLVGAGGRFYGFPSNDISDRLNAEIFSPPYLFKGVRPAITSAPQTANFGSTIPVQTPDAAGIASVSLIRLAAVTHAFNIDQRFLPLTFTASAGQLNVQMPANANLAPPGYYMLFILNASGVPSPAAIIKMQ